jgi:hypothetical protein
MSKDSKWEDPIPGEGMHREHTTPPTDPRVAFGAQPAEAELTDAQIKNLELFTQEEIDFMLPWELTLMMNQHHDVLKEMIDIIRKEREEWKLSQLPPKGKD